MSIRSVVEGVWRIDVRDLSPWQRVTALVPYLNAQHGIRQELAGVYIAWRRS